MTSQQRGSLVRPLPGWENDAETPLKDSTPQAPDPDKEIPYLRCKECDTPCYVFEASDGRIREAMCIACGNDSVTLFTVADWDDEEG